MSCDMRASVQLAKLTGTRILPLRCTARILVRAKFEAALSSFEPSASPQGRMDSKPARYDTPHLTCVWGKRQRHDTYAHACTRTRTLVVPGMTELEIPSSRCLLQ